MERIKVFLAIFLLLISSRGFSDEISRIRELLKVHYQEVIPAYESIVKNNRKGLGNYIDGAYGGYGLKIQSVMLKAVQQQLSDADAVILCLNQHRSLGGDLDRFINEENRSPNISEYRRATYTPEVAISIATAVNALNANYSECLAKIQRTRNALEILETYKSDTHDVCQIASQEMTFARFQAEKGISRHERIKLDADDFISWPGIEFQISKNFGCDGSVDKCSTSISAEAKDQKQGQVDKWQLMRAHYPELLSSLVYSFLVTESAMAVVGAEAMSASAASGPAFIVVFASAVLIGAYEAGVTAQRVQRLKDYINSQEDRIDQILAGGVDKAEFEAKLAERCPELNSKYKNDLVAKLSKIGDFLSLRDIDDYFTGMDNYVSWYNRLFLDLTDGSNPLLDVITKEAMELEKFKFYEDIYESRTKLSLASASNELKRQQAKVSLASCSASNSSERRALKRLIRSYSSICEEIASTIGRDIKLSTGSQLLQIQYTGFEYEAARLEVVPNSGPKMDVRILTRSGQTIAEYFGITSENLVDFPFVNISGTDFGLSNENKVDFGSFPMSELTNISFLPEESLETSIKALKSTNSLVRRKLARCSRVFSESEPFTNIDPVKCNISVRGI